MTYTISCSVIARLAIVITQSICLADFRKLGLSVGDQCGDTSSGLWFSIFTFAGPLHYGPRCRKELAVSVCLGTFLLPSAPSATAPRCWPLSFLTNSVSLSLLIRGGWARCDDWSPLNPRRLVRDLGFVLPPSLRNSYEGSLTCGITDLIIVRTCNPKRHSIEPEDNFEWEQRGFDAPASPRTVGPVILGEGGPGAGNTRL